MTKKKQATVPNPFLTAEFYQGALGTRVRMTLDNDDKHIQKVVNLDDFSKIISSSLEEQHEEEFIRIGKLPQDYVDGAVGKDGSYKAVILKKGKKRCLNYFKAKHYYIPFPDLYFLLEITKNGTVRSKYCFASVKGKDRLYEYPFGNVDKNGSICMGNIARKYGSLHELDDFIEDFFLGVTNDDYYGTKPGVFKKQLDLLDALTTRSTFPSKWLVPSTGKYTTIKDLM